MQVLVEMIHSINPQTIIIVSGILPRRVDYQQTGHLTRAVNQMLNTMAAHNSFCFFIDPAGSFLRGGSPDARLYAYADGGLHLSPEGTRVLRRLFGDAVKPWVRRLQQGTLPNFTCPCHHPGALPSIPPQLPGLALTLGSPTTPRYVQGLGDPLSNFWVHPITYMERVYSSGEQLFQYFQALRHYQYRLSQRLLHEHCPIELRRRTRRIHSSCPVTCGWNISRVQIVRDTIQARIAQQPLFVWMLRQSSPHHISHNVDSNYWGEIPGVGGQNTYGILLMEARHNL